MTNKLAVRVLYFAWLREKIGQSDEEIVLGSPISARECINQLIEQSQAHTAALSDLGPIRIAINQKLASLDEVFQPGDELELFPPFTGGCGNMPPI